MFELLALPFKAVFGLLKLGFELFFGLFHGVFSLVFGLIGLVLGLFEGLFGLAVVGAVIAFVAWMFNKGFHSGKQQKERVVDADEEEFRSFYQQHR